MHTIKEKLEDNKLDTWNRIFDVSTEKNPQDASICSDSLDEVSDILSLQSFSTVEHKREWLLSFEGYLKNIDYYCNNNTPKRKFKLFHL